MTTMFTAVLACLSDIAEVWGSGVGDTAHEDCYKLSGCIDLDCSPSRTCEEGVVVVGVA